MTTNAILKDNYQYYLDNKEELCKKYLNKYIVIKNEEVIGAFDTMEEAVDNVKDIEAGTYIIQRCENNENVQIFHTRVRFNV